MLRLAFHISLLLLGLATIEATARWWMHAKPSGIDQPVLCYFHKPAVTNDAKAPANSTDALPPVRTELPDLVAKSMPSLRCSSGTAARVENADGSIIHLAFFEWNQIDSTSVLEAFKHLPDDCMGSIGMKLVEHGKPRSYQLGKETLIFDHTVFLDRSGMIVHAFKSTWVSGSAGLLGDGLRGGSEQWRQIRWKAATKRFRPAYARVAQGAVRGITNPDKAWLAFQETMLKDLRFEAPRA